MADFRPGQLEAIDTAWRGERALVVQRTGWGKSAVYFIACQLLRRASRGPTLVISPLLVLMRNQVEAAQRLGLRAFTINSSLSTEERDTALREVPNADMIFVTPESLQSAWFVPDVLSRLDKDPSLIVVDEVHCISEWGHDFRPTYRRIRQFLDRLPSGVGVLGTTATASRRTMEDIEEQLGRNLVTITGSLARHSLRLFVEEPRSRPFRLAWLDEFVQGRAGAGIIYTLTVHDAERVARWLAGRGIDALAYTGELPDRERRDIEARLTRNEVEAVVATTALGMGYDKPDLRWIVHFQMPAGPVSYYQQVGRAGRAVPEATAVMLRGPEDADIHEYFIETAYPDEGTARDLLDLIDRHDEGMSNSEILSAMNISAGRLSTALVILADDGVLERAGSRYFRTARRYEYPRERVEAVAAAKRREFEMLQRYAEGARCLMATLQEALDDDTAAPCGRCGPCTGDSVGIHPAAESVRVASQFIWNQAEVLEPRKMWPPGFDSLLRGSIDDLHLAESGRTLGRYQDGGYGDEVLTARERGLATGVLVDGIVQLVEEWSPQPPPEWIAWIPSNSNAAFIEDVAGLVAQRLRLPAVGVVSKLRGAPPQQRMANSQQAARNAWQALGVDEERVPPGPVLLIDDVVRSRWTFTVASYKLRDAGVPAVHPLGLCLVPGAS